MKSKTSVKGKDNYKVAESFAALTSSSETTKLTVNTVGSDQISVGYNTMPGNAPNSYGNYLAIWENQNSIPWNKEPKETKKIEGNASVGSTVFGGLDINRNSYIVGYAVGPVLTGEGMQRNGNVCATDFIPQSGEGSNNSNEFSPRLIIKNVGINSLDMEYFLPDGNTPLANGAWVGIWRRSVVPFEGPSPDAKNNITLDASSGGALLNNISLGRGNTYVVGLFTSGWAGPDKPSKQTALACSTSFTV